VRAWHDADVRGTRSWWILLAAAGVLTAGCTLPARNSTNEVDRHRAGILRDEPLFRTADTPPSVEVGWATAGPHDWRRPNAHGTVARWQPAREPAAAARDGESRVARAVASLRENGWVVLWARCTPPAAPLGQYEPAPTYDSPARNPDPDAWNWQAVGYRIHDGVSYWFELTGEAVPGGSGELYLDLVAPHHFDDSDLFPDRPAGLAVGDTCVERPGQSPGIEEDGRYLEMEMHHAADVPNRDPWVR
jgi:hypothetical protein